MERASVRAGLFLRLLRERPNFPYPSKSPIPSEIPRLSLRAGYDRLTIHSTSWDQGGLAGEVRRQFRRWDGPASNTRLFSVKRITNQVGWPQSRLHSLWRWIHES